MYYYTLWPIKFIYCSFHQAHTLMGLMGVYRSRRTPRIRFSWFGVRPCRFKATRSQKPLKKEPNVLKMAIFERFLASDCFRTEGLHSKPRKLNSGGSSRPVDSHKSHGGGGLVKIQPFQTFVLIFWWSQRPLVTSLINSKEPPISTLYVSKSSTM